MRDALLDPASWSSAFGGMEAGLEGDLAEVHRLLALTNSALVRDHLYALLKQLLQVCFPAVFRKAPIKKGAGALQKRPRIPFSSFSSTRQPGDRSFGRSGLVERRAVQRR